MLIIYNCIVAYYTNMFFTKLVRTWKWQRLLSLSTTTRATEYTYYILERVIQSSRLLGKYPRSRLLENENNNFSFSITYRREFSVLAKSYYIPCLLQTLLQTYIFHKTCQNLEMTEDNGYCHYLLLLESLNTLIIFSNE